METNFFAPVALEGVPNSVEVNGKPYREEIYTPIFNSPSVAFGQEVQNVILQFDSDAYILLDGIQLIAHQFELGQGYKFQFEMFDSTGQSLTNGLMYGLTLGGISGYTVPFPIVPPRIFRPGDFLVFTVKNYGTSGSMDFQLALRCRKRFPA